MRGWAFWVLAALALLGAVGMVALGRRAARAVLCLGLCLLGLAGLYALLDAPFLGVAQVLLYSGVALVLWLAAVDSSGGRGPAPREGDRQPLAKLAGAALLALVAVKALALHAAVREPLPALPEHFGSARRLGVLLYGDYAQVLPALAALLAAAVVSAVLLAKRRID
jgi:NADH-quinone oxidoreductase subunit J